MQRHPRWFLISSIAVLVLVATACGGGANAAGGTAPTLSILSPADGATVAEPFDIRLQASVPLGELGTGNDHVHLCVAHQGQEIAIEERARQGPVEQAQCGLAGRRVGTVAAEGEEQHG